MAAPTSGHSYNGDQRVPGEHGDNRFGFPAASGGQGPGQYQPYQQQEHQQHGVPGGPGSEWPQQQPGQGWPQQPQQRHDTSQQQRIQPVQQRRAPEPAKPAAHNPLVRPYAMTGGRTRPRYQLAIEALVSTTADPARLQGQLPEHQRICRLCIEIKSVAEISALSRSPSALPGSSSPTWPRPDSSLSISPAATRPPAASQM
ncbi:hypothetical protein SBADM41S_03184 [Streptomyces badius]